MPWSFFIKYRLFFRETSLLDITKIKSISKRTTTTPVDLDTRLPSESISGEVNPIPSPDPKLPEEKLQVSEKLPGCLENENCIELAKMISKGFLITNPEMFMTHYESCGIKFFITNLESFINHSEFCGIQLNNQNIFVKNLAFESHNQETLSNDICSINPMLCKFTSLHCQATFYKKEQRLHIPSLVINGKPLEVDLLLEQNSPKIKFSLDKTKPIPLTELLSKTSSCDEFISYKEQKLHIPNLVIEGDLPRYKVDLQLEQASFPIKFILDKIKPLLINE